MIILLLKKKLSDNKLTTDVEYETITLITQNKKEYKKIKDFLNYLLDSEDLLKLTVDCFINKKIKFSQFEDGLMLSYKTYEYNKFSDEIPVNNTNDSKKLKL